MNKPSENELHAYVDNQLDPARRHELEQWLAEHPEEANQVNNWKKQQQLIQQTFTAELSAPIPDHLKLAARRPAAQRPAWFRVAAAVAWMTFGGIVGFNLQDKHIQEQHIPPIAANPPPSFLPIAQQATLAHVVYTPEVRHPVEVGADQEAHLVKWLSKRLGIQLRIPQLTSRGYRLIGGRLLPGDKGPVAHFMYENNAGNRLTLYVRHDAAENRETAFHYTQTNKVGVFYWVDRELGYALTGELPRDQLLGLAELTYDQLSS
ncbi:anti-sigma factor [Endozoicomonas sp. SM1973]|uniref:Anti-sigma factor n=1 Tax=Spartinivicinus marinus TaxID=2994442 RepID=A0A853HUY9_9GAMM|nr:anti-sigma factor [Spartinivicinus marinus]MCX4028245.1 anti-sigma factor [Spartinivicinus marinus]NYZ65580.1 anti-sigma factor [Spartinivicinus marinus]